MDLDSLTRWLKGNDGKFGLRRINNKKNNTHYSRGLPWGPDVDTLILSYLNVSDLCRCAGVNKAFANLARTNWLWQDHYARIFEDQKSPLHYLSSSSSSSSRSAASRLKLKDSDDDHSDNDNDGVDLEMQSYPPLSVSALKHSSSSSLSPSLSSPSSSPSSSSFLLSSSAPSSFSSRDAKSDFQSRILSLAAQSTTHPDPVQTSAQVCSSSGKFIIIGIIVLSLTTAIFVHNGDSSAMNNLSCGSDFASCVIMLLLFIFLLVITALLEPIFRHAGIWSFSWTGWDLEDHKSLSVFLGYVAVGFTVLIIWLIVRYWQELGHYWSLIRERRRQILRALRD